MFNKKMYIKLFLIVIAAAMILTGNVSAQNEPLIAVMPFEEGDLSWKGFRSEEILNGITQLVTDKLVQKDGIRVVERTRIYDILDEQDFGQSGRVDPATAAEIGRILGVDYLVLGTLTRLEVVNEGGISFGPLTVTGIKARVVLSGRIVNTTTAEILSSFKGEGEESEASISITDLEGLSFGTKAFASSILGKSVEEAAVSFVANIDPFMMEEKPVNYIDGMVLKVIGNKLVIDVGSRQNIVKKQTGRLLRLIEVEGLDEPVEMPLGRVIVYSVSRNASIVKILELDEGEVPFEGDIVQFEIRDTSFDNYYQDTDYQY